MTDKARFDELMTAKSTSSESKVFTVMPGSFAVIRAFGLQDSKDRPDVKPNPQRRVAQAACLYSLLYDEEPLPDKPGCATPIINLSEFKGVLIERDLLYIDNCTFSLTSCSTVMMIDIPGTYQFILNDDTAIGRVRIYLHTISGSDFRRNSKLFVGG